MVRAARVFRHTGWVRVTRLVGTSGSVEGNSLLVVSRNSLVAGLRVRGGARLSLAIVGPAVSRLATDGIDTECRLLFEATATLSGTYTVKSHWFAAECFR